MRTPCDALSDINSRMRKLIEDVTICSLVVPVFPKIDAQADLFGGSADGKEKRERSDMEEGDANVGDLSSTSNEATRRPFPLIL